MRRCSAISSGLIIQVDLYNVDYDGPSKHSQIVYTTANSA